MWIENHLFKKNIYSVCFQNLYYEFIFCNTFLYILTSVQKLSCSTDLFVLRNTLYFKILILAGYQLFLLENNEHFIKFLFICHIYSFKVTYHHPSLLVSFSWTFGEGNGNPLQCSCLENPRDGGAWWAAVYGVTQSRTRLKWLSSSSGKVGHKPEYLSSGPPRAPFWLGRRGNKEMCRRRARPTHLPTSLEMSMSLIKNYVS